MKFLFAIGSIFFLYGNYVIAQEKSEPRYINRKSLGGLVEVGIPFYHLPEGTSYTPVLLIANYHQPFFKAVKFFNMAMDFAPQIGFATGKRSGLEVGLNAALLLCFAIGNSSILSLQAGSGPHYISYMTARQANGFIFSDNFLIEYRKQLSSKKAELNINAGFRHISNLNIKEPNTGIDNIIIGFGVSKLW